MKITLDEVRATAKLARLELDEAEVERLARELGAILEYMERLAAVDVSGVPPMTHAVAVDCPLAADEPGPGLPVEAALAGAPDQEGDRFRVPRVIGEDS